MHPSGSEIRLFAFGRLAPQSWDRVAEHLESCEECQQAFDNIAFQNDTVVEKLRSAHLARTELDRVEAERHESAEKLNSIGDYDVITLLGRGGMGVVYKARHRLLGRMVAIKLISQGREDAPEFRDRFHREAKTVAGLQHPNVVQLLQFGEHQGQPYCVFELVDGGSLVEPSQPLRSARETAQLLEALSRAVAHAHENGVLHRDLKPANVLIADDGTPKIADFGLAKRTEEDSLQTETGALLGTASYMAPEQALGKSREVSPRTDVYGLGAILYEQLCGQPPFRGESVLETLDLVRRSEVTRPSTLRGTVARDLETICLRCLEKSPEDRYPSATALADDLARFVNNEPIHARPVGRGERLLKWCKRHPARAALSLVSLVAVLLLVLYAQRIGNDQLKDVQIAEAKRSRYALRLRDLWEVSQVDPEAALARLDDTGDFPQGLRDFAWRLTRARCRREQQRRRSTTPAPENRRLSALASSPAGKILVGAEDGEIIVWDAARPADGPSLLKAHSDRVNRVVVSEDGSKAASAARDGSVMVWDLQTHPPSQLAKLVARQPRDSDTPLDVNSVAFLDSGRLALARADGTVSIWPFANSTSAAVLGRHEKSALCLALAPGGDYLLSGGRDQRIRVWDWRSRQPVGDYPGHVSPISQLCCWVDVSGQHYALSATIGRDRMRRWRLDEGGKLALEREFFDHQTPITSLAVRGKLLLSGGADGWIRVWDPEVRMNEPITKFAAGQEIHAIAIGADRKNLYAVSSDYWASFDISPEASSEIVMHQSRITGLSFVDSKTLYTASESGLLSSWRLDDGVGASRSEQLARISDLRLSRDGQRLAWVSDGTVHIRPMGIANGKDVEFPTDAVWLNGLALSSSGDRIAIAGGQEPGGQLLKLAESQSELSPAATEASETMAVAFDTEDKILAFGDDAGALHLVDVASGRTTQGTCHKTFIARIAFSPDGRHLATAGGDGAIAIWTTDGTHQRTLSGHVGAVWSLLFTPDGRTLISGGADLTVRCWDPIVGDERLRLAGHRAPVTRLAISPEGATLASGDEAGRVLLWRASHEP